MSMALKTNKLQLRDSKEFLISFLLPNIINSLRKDFLNWFIFLVRLFEDVVIYISSINLALIVNSLRTKSTINWEHQKILMISWRFIKLETRVQTNMIFKIIVRKHVRIVHLQLSTMRCLKKRFINNIELFA